MLTSLGKDGSERRRTTKSAVEKDNVLSEKVDPARRLEAGECYLLFRVGKGSYGLNPQPYEHGDDLRCEGRETKGKMMIGCTSLLSSPTNFNMPSSTSTLLQFSPFSLFPSPSFWNSLSTLQLDDLRLSDEPVAVTAAYHVGRWVIDRATGKEVSMGCRLGIEGDSLKGKQR